MGAGQAGEAAPELCPQRHPFPSVPTSGLMKLERTRFANFVPESFSQTLFWVKDRKLSNAAQINLSRS